MSVNSQLTNSERRVSPSWSVQYLKEKLETITGIPPFYQQVLIYNTDSVEPVDASGVSGDALVSSLGVKQGARVQVNDTRPDSELLDLVDDGKSSDVYYEMKDEEYDKVSNSVRQWKKDNQLGRFNPEFVARQQELKQQNLSKSSQLTVGSRFRTVNDPQGERRGVIRYVGPVREIDAGAGVWCGVQFDEPVGKNNGSIKGVEYFRCKDRYGGFLKPLQIEQGDFPEQLLDELDLDEL